jgi:hypothetical protein
MLKGVWVSAYSRKVSAPKSSLQPTINLVNSIFQHQLLKDKPFKTFKAATEQFVGINFTIGS